MRLSLMTLGRCSDQPAPNALNLVPRSAVNVPGRCGGKLIDLGRCDSSFFEPVQTTRNLRP